jgi:PAS domain S-box-containing protein
MPTDSPAERRSEDVLEALPHIVWTADENGSVDYANRRWLEYSGLGLEETLGPGGARAIHPEDREAAVGKWLEAVPRRATFEAEYRVRRFDGEYRWFSVLAEPTLGPDGRFRGWVGVWTDVDDRRRAEAALRASEERYRAFVELQAEAVWRFELEEPVEAGLPEDEQLERFYRHGYLAECNDAMARMYGLSGAGEIVGARLGDLLPPQPHNLDYLRAFVRSGYRLTDAETLEPDREGRERRFLNNLVGVVEAGRLLRAWGTQRDVTEAWRAEAAVRELNAGLEARVRERTAELERREELLRAVVESAPVVLFALDEKGAFTLSQGRGLRALGLAPGEVVGRSALEVYRDEPGVLADVRRALGGEALANVAQVGGATFETWYAPSRDEGGRVVGAVGVALDVTEREGTAAALRESGAFFRALFEVSPDAIFLIDPHAESPPWAILECNEAAGRMNGYAREELLGRSIDLLHPTNDPPAEREAYLEKLRRRGVVRVEAVHRRKDGQLVEIEAATSLVRLGGRELLLGIDRDVTDRKRVQATLARANRELEEKNAEQETFIYTVSHDLRAPLLSIQGMSDLLGEAVAGGDAEEARFLLGRVTKNVEKMGQLLQDLLTFSRVGRLEEEAEGLNLGDAVAATLGELEPRLEGRGVALELPERWPRVVYPPSDAYQLVANLLSNAAKWAGRPGEPPRVRLGWEAGGDEVTLRVSDNGPGVPPEHRERVFGLFQRLDPKAEGTGVGLAIVKRIAERHAGKVWVEDSPLGGATFAVTLPTGAKVGR